MGNYPWREDRINNTDSRMREYGCAITGMSNILTDSLANRAGRGYHTPANITPPFINRESNFYGNTDNLDWSSVASSMGMTATRSEIGNSNDAQAQLLSASMSANNVYVLIQVPITTREGPSSHWVGVDGPLVDLYGNNDLWAKVSATSSNDNASRLNNSNWAQGGDGSMYVKVEAVQGTVTIK
jgi:hypothetical protein